MDASETFDDLDCDGYSIIHQLPNEILGHILTILDVHSLCMASQVCRRWYGLVYCNDCLWKMLCNSLTLDQHLIQYDRDVLGLTWKASFIRNYGSIGIKRKWRAGVFSSPNSYAELPPKPLCVMDAASWGEIFQQELQR